MPLKQTPLTGHRAGLIENAAGQLTCPRCHSHRVLLNATVVANDQATTWLTEKGVKVTPAREGKLAVDAVVGIHLACHEGHFWRMDVVETEGSVTLTTEWDMTGQEDTDDDGR